MPSREEGLIAALQVFDQDSNGTISAAELKAILLRPIGGKPAMLTEAQADYILENSVNGDGVYDFTEFTRWVVGVLPPKMSQPRLHLDSIKFDCETPMVGILWTDFRKLSRLLRSDQVPPASCLSCTALV